MKIKGAEWRGRREKQPKKHGEEGERKQKNREMGELA